MARLAHTRFLVVNRKFLFSYISLKIKSFTSRNAVFSGPGVENDVEVGVTSPVTKERQKKGNVESQINSCVPIFTSLFRQYVYFSTKFFIIKHFICVIGT